MKHAHHQTYSSDLPASDFAFWLHQRKVDGYRAETPSELLVRVRVRIRIRLILAEIPRETLNTVFLEWMDGWSDCKNVCREMVSM
jgi:hypothetical protein